MLSLRVLYVAWDRHFYTYVATSVVIDDSLLQDPSLRINTKEEIDRCLKFAFAYFKENFRIKFRVKNRSTIPFDRVIQESEIRPTGEKLIIIFRNSVRYSQGSENAWSDIEKCMIYNDISFHENNEAYKWLLIHELCHQFNAIDLQDPQSIMHGEQFLNLITKEVNGVPTSIYNIREIDPQAVFQLDSKTHEIIELSKNEYSKTNHVFISYPFSIAKEIINRYETLLPQALFQGDLNITIGNYFYSMQDYEKSLKYYLNSLNVRQAEKDILTINPVHHISEEDKYASLVKNCCLLSKFDDLIVYANRIPDDGKWASLKYRYMSIAYGNKGEIDTAIDWTKKQLEMKNGDETVWPFLGCLYLRKVPLSVWNGEDVEQAISAFSKALELDPNNGTAYFNLYAIYKNSGDTEKADRCFSMLKSMNFDMNSSILKKDGYVQITP